MRGGFRPSKEADKDICPAVRQQVNVTRKRVVILLQHIISIVLVIQDGKGRRVRVLMLSRKIRVGIETHMS